MMLRVFQRLRAARAVFPVTDGCAGQSTSVHETMRLRGPPPCHGCISGWAPQNGHPIASRWLNSFGSLVGLVIGAPMHVGNEISRSLPPLVGGESPVCVVRMLRVSLAYVI
jgi:hypothetical protein